MITTLNPKNTIYSTEDDERYSGVVQVMASDHYGTGTLLYDGRAVLTAAHVATDSASETSVIFNLPSGQKTISVSKVEQYSLYDDASGNNDLAIVWLSEQAPSNALRSEIYRDTDEVGQTMSMVGYGAQGVGNSGEDDTIDVSRIAAQNKFDTTADILKDGLGTYIGWDPTSDIIVADFDNSTAAHDASGMLLDINDTGFGAQEGLVASGDSGGPAFIGDKVAGIASYVAGLNTSTKHPDIDDVTNSSFGEFAFWHRTSSYQEFIDKSLRQEYKNQITSANDVVKEITEGGTNDVTVNYFFLELSGLGTRTETSSIQYTTRDGSATAGEDYLAISGQVNVYTDESYVLIPVEILGDSVSEGNEIFYLDITNPMGGTFASGEVTLTAQRTIVDDDLFA